MKNIKSEIGKKADIESKKEKGVEIENLTSKWNLRQKNKYNVNNREQNINTFLIIILFW